MPQDKNYIRLNQQIFRYLRWVVGKNLYAALFMISDIDIQQYTFYMRIPCKRGLITFLHTQKIDGAYYLSGVNDENLLYISNLGLSSAAKIRNYIRKTIIPSFKRRYMAECSKLDIIERAIR